MERETSLTLEAGAPAIVSGTFSKRIASGAGYGV